jgi:hypothetical protein
MSHGENGPSRSELSPNHHLADARHVLDHSYYLHGRWYVLAGLERDGTPGYTETVGRSDQGIFSRRSRIRIVRDTNLWCR